MDALEYVKFPLEIALEEIEKQREKITKYEKDDVEACKLYMAMAKTAIDGLVKEAQSIMLQARSIDNKNPQEIDILYERINKYLYTDNLRPALNDSISGLNGISDAMITHANRPLQWPWIKRIRQGSVENFQNLLQQLTDFLQGLQSKYLPGGSGMLVSDLYEIMRIVDNIREKKVEYSELAVFIESSEKDRSNTYNEWLKLNGELTEIFEKIRTTIR